MTKSVFQDPAMKLLVVLVGLIALCSGNAIPPSPEEVSYDELPTIPGDNSHYVEGKSRYIWMPNGDGEPQLVDLHEPADENILRNRNGANNAYWLFTRSNPNSAQILVQGNAASVSNSNYVASRPLKVIVHGWNGNGNAGMNTQIRQAFLAVMDANVIVLDWRALANANYVSAVLGVPSVGQFLGNFINWLFTTAGGNWNNVHIVGFSLGAHVVGNAGRAAGGRISRVTGLDPAGPMWAGNSNALRATDGQYVEAIHTDGGGLGIMTAIANGDFYPNGGRNPQPGCSNSNCSHGRAPSFFAATVQFNHLTGRQCNNMAQAQASNCNGVALNMGNSIVSKRGSGLFGLRTGSSWPF